MLERTAGAIADVKQTALYFDYVIPLNFGIEVVRTCMFAYDKHKYAGETIREFFSRYYVPRTFPEDFFDKVLPPELIRNWDFRARLLDVVGASGKATLDGFAPGEELPPSLLEYGKVSVALLREYDLTGMPLAFPTYSVMKEKMESLTPPLPYLH